MPFRTMALIAALASAAPALAAEARDLCPDRPGLGTPACTVEAGQLVFELGLADWTREDDGPQRTDTILAGEGLLRIGLTSTLEAQIGWTTIGHVRERNAIAGTVEGRTRTGDVTFALRQNLRNPDGSGFSIAAMPYASVPTGGSGVGAGDWGAGLLVPVSIEAGSVSIGLTPHVDAAVDGDGNGRHLAYGTVAGIGFDLSGDASMAAELSVTRDRDPAGRSTELLAGLSAGWQPDDDSQWDIGANLGLNHDSPDLQLYAGYVRRF
ncbi:transporter [Sphingopyxis sp. BSN-002]|uniref:transporter n=1 Tax=Sphingopyxis sp. BSN-002 TaxID=2911495 RepID=UPI001EDBD959|nr:transporter [Sphingopyxis sp. BSN-002]UKK85472.1 transporter [Sphingopyxis sp. BSN-002]